MSKLYFDYNGLNRGFIEDINNNIGRLDNALNIFNNLDIPYFYNRRRKIKEIKNSIESKRKELVNIKNWVINSNNEYDRVNKEFYYKNSKLSRSKFGTRKGL